MTERKIAQKIWYVSKYAITPAFGNPTRQFLFSKYMARKDRDVTLVSSRSVGGSKMPNLGFKNQLVYKFENLNCVLLNGPKISLGFNLKRIFSWLIFELRFLYWALFKTKERPDVIIVSSLSLLTFLSGLVLKKVFKCRLVCEVRDIWPLTLLEAKNWSKRNIFIRFFSLIERVGYKGANAIIGTMPNLNGHVKLVAPGFESKVKYMPMGFDPEIWNDDFGLSNFKFDKLADDYFTVGYAGTIGLANCVDQIISAAAILKEEKIKFAILGDGPLKRQIEDRISELKLTNVIILDSVPKSEVSAFLKKCDLLLNPWMNNNTLYQYGVSPNKWIDYMYSAKPILVSLDGFPCIIDEAGCGKFIPAGDPKLMADEILAFYHLGKEELVAMGDKGKQFLYKNLHYNTLTNNYLDILDSILID